MLNCGYVKELKMPKVLKRNENDVEENFWVKFPQYSCCPMKFQEQNYRNSIILTSPKFVTPPHTDIGTPGTTVFTVHKGRKLMVFLKSSSVQEEGLSIDDFFDRIIRGKEETYFIDIRQNDVISFPIDCFHLVVTMEATVASFFQVLGPVEKAHFKSIGVECREDLGTVRVLEDHICFNQHQEDHINLETIYEVRRYLKKCIPFSSRLKDNEKYSFNDLFFHCAKLLKEKEVNITRFHSKQFYHPEETAIFEIAQIDVRHLRLAFYITSLVTDLIKYRLNPDEEKFHCGFQKQKSLLPLIRELGSVIPILNYIPNDNELFWDDTFRARFCREFCFQKLLLVRRIVRRLHVSSLDLYKDMDPKQVLSETEKDLLDWNLLPTQISLHKGFKSEEAHVEKNQIETSFTVLVENQDRKKLIREFLDKL
jgi:hypothetical protein